MGVLLHFLAEIFYTLWSPLWQLATLPITGLFSFFEKFPWSSRLSFLSPLSFVLWSTFIYLGLVFLGKLILFRSRRFQKWKKRVRASAGRALLLFGWLITVLIAFLFFYPEAPQLFPAVYFVFLSLLLLGITSIVWFLFIGVVALGSRWATISGQWRRVISIVGTVLLLYPFVVVLVFFVWILRDPLGNPQGSRFHVLHAAIKNTCLGDPARVNCPQTLEELSYIEPVEFARAQECCQMRYQYNPETNEYVFAVRYHPLRAAVYSQQLVQTEGIDFQEYTVSVLGKDHLADPPPFADSWQFPEWRYSIFFEK